MIACPRAFIAPAAVLVWIGTALGVLFVARSDLIAVTAIALATAAYLAVPISRREWRMLLGSTAAIVLGFTLLESTIRLSYFG